MELLCIKVGSQYLKGKPPTFELTQLNKASVFPLSEFEKVKELSEQFSNLSRLEQPDLKIKIIKLTIVEEEIDT